MENFGFSGLAKTLYQRVILSYRTTLIGLAFVAGDALLSYLTSVNLPSAVHYGVGILAAGFALVKEQSAIPPLASPKGSARLGATAALAALLGCASLTACKTLPPVVTDVLQCGEQAIVAQIPSLTGQIVAILRAGATGWQSLLLSLISAAGDAGRCAWAVVYAQIQGGLSLSDRPTAAVPADVQARAAEFQALLVAQAKAQAARR
jgi:hypothetical protein